MAAGGMDRAESGSGAGYRILVVEDDAIFVELLKRALRAAGMAIEVATSLGEACERIARTPYHVVVLDLGLPDSWAFSTLDRIIETVAPNQVIVVSGNEVEIDMLKHRYAGVHFFAKASFEPRVLADLVKGTAEAAAHEARQHDAGGGFGMR